MMKQKKATGKYLIVPVSGDQTPQKIKLNYDDDSTNLEIPAVSPDRADFTASYLLPGKENCIEADETFFEYASFSDLPAEKDHSLHQYFHLTAGQGWINDPNGLYFLNGEWHCFFQYNPFSANWGNMHWNHAVSHDLIHWNESGITLYPDRTGYMFSGSAVIDRENVSGLGKNAILLYYTSAGYTGKQALAYSTDQGKSFQKYAENPLIESVEGLMDRDPAVVYDPDEKIWYMPLYSGNEKTQEFYLFTSKDLLHWQKSDSYFIPGGRECPGLQRMKDSADGRWKWVFTEANCYYRTAEIHAGKIHFFTDSERTLFGTAYAGQFFCNAPDDRQIYLAWIRMPECRFRTWNGCMSLPMEFQLKNNHLLVSPYTVPERTERTEKPVIPFQADFKVGKNKISSFRIGKTEFVFDLLKKVLHVEKDSISLPENFTGGRLFADHASVEFFDDSGTFAVCLYLPENNGLSVTGFENADYYNIIV